MNYNKDQVSLIIAGFTSIGIVLLILLIFTPIDNRDYTVSTHWKEWSFKKKALTEWFRQKKRSKSEIGSGFSSESLAIDLVLPLAGYGDRENNKVSFKTASNLEIAVLSLSNSFQTVCIITADLLIIHPDIAKGIVDSLNLYFPEAIPYFTASHTHSSLGGWAPGVVGERFAGEFSKPVVDTLLQKFWQCTKKSIENIKPVLIHQAWIEDKQFVYNRLDSMYGKVNGRLSLLHLSSSALNVTFVTYPAHATVLDTSNNIPHGDYPQYLKKLINEAFGSHSLFAAGAVGSMGPKTEGCDTIAAQYMSKGLFQQILLLKNFLGQQNQSKEIAFASFSFEVPLPDPHWRVSQYVAIRPWLFKKWFGETYAQIQVILLGDFIYMSMPGDFSGELALSLEKKAAEKNKQLVVTSFNGSYTGYILPSKYYQRDTYESRVMSWYGPNYGEFIEKIASDIIDVLE